MLRRTPGERGRWLLLLHVDTPNCLMLRLHVFPIATRCLLQPPLSASRAQYSRSFFSMFVLPSDCLYVMYLYRLCVFPSDCLYAVYRCVVVGATAGG